jgi:formate dehydrogenase subunit gamma
MRGKYAMRWLLGIVVLVCMAALPRYSTAADPAGGAAAQRERQITQPGNNAPLWRDVRRGENPYQTTQVRGVETNILVQSEGQSWRLLRPWVFSAGGMVIAVALLILLGYYLWRGSIPLHQQPTGRLIRRFSSLERMTHWTVAISFVTLGITGITMTFGKYLLLPILGYPLFSWLAIAAKNLHNFVAPVFLLALPVLILVFMRDHLPKRYDWAWLKTFGGLLSKSGTEVASGRFNAGEKVLFWTMVCVLSVVLCLSGVVLLFANFEQGRFTMQSANIVHMVCALLAIAMACFHIYLGTIGMKGAYQGMHTGYVDEAWAAEHHEIWYQEVKAGTAQQKFVDEVPPEVKMQVEQSIKA